MDSARPIEIEPWPNRLLIHRLSSLLLAPARRAGIHPNTVTCMGFGFGLLAASSYAMAGQSGSRWAFATLGLLLMLAWLVMDGLDGQLARATGKSSDIGRLLDGVADYATFVVVNIALVATHPRPLAAFALALLSGVFHALQSQFYEGERATYIRRLSGKFQAIARAEAGGPYERFYNRCEALLGNRTRPFDLKLQAAGPAERELLLSRWQPGAARALRAASPLSSDGRAIVIWVAVLAGETMLYWFYEIGVLTLVALAAAHKLRQSEAGAMAGDIGAGQTAGATGSLAGHAQKKGLTGHV
ncbi:CDP-alcohol phosphatidyltransferase family protein [Sandaracinobacteroides hominis]|uniref:CDP-alcohol phosphatidyltransferase family protein n=1 Tax=Sandaracinobacteroides hominis TaxID=2780086 RepID=UPI0018F6857C|nr:CDP-alcohol phosphatidyltransferase family protein [Sandaracinobacteroides hominis]